MKKTSEENLTDGELLGNYKTSRNNEWLGILLSRYTLLLFGVCLKYLKNEEDAKDAVQQIFLKVLNEVHQYNIDHFKGWLYTVARNFCLMKLRGSKEKQMQELNDEYSYLPEDVGIKEKIENEKLLTLIESSLPELNDAQKTCVTLFYLHKLTYNKISEQTGFSVLQVKSHIQNGKRNLRLLVDKKRQ